jgi:hypothetical protein
MLRSPRSRPGGQWPVRHGVTGMAVAALTLVGSAALPGAQTAARAEVVGYVTHQIGAGAACRNTDGRMEIFALGSDAAVWQDTQSAVNASTWNGWSSLNGTVNAIPVCGQESDGQLEVFDTSSSGAVWHNLQTSPGAGSWSGWSSLGGDVVPSSVSVVKTADGRLNLFAISATNYSVQLDAQTTPGGSWTGWTSLGIPGSGAQPQFAQLAAIQNTDGRLEAFAVSGLTTYYDVQTTPGGAWSGWATFGANGETHSVWAARNTYGQVEILSWNKYSGEDVLDNAQATAGGSWRGWISLPTVAPTGPPIVTQNQDGRLEAYVTATDGNVYRDWQTSPGGSWFGWSSLGKPSGTLADSPAADQNADGRLQVFITTTDGTIWTNWQVTPGSGYGGWVSLG